MLVIYVLYALKLKLVEETIQIQSLFYYAIQS